MDKASVLLKMKYSVSWEQAHLTHPKIEANEQEVPHSHWDQTVITEGLNPAGHTVTMTEASKTRSKTGQSRQSVTFSHFGLLPGTESYGRYLSHLGSGIYSLLSYQ